MLVRSAAIIAPFTCDGQRRCGFSRMAAVRTRVLGARSAVPVPPAGSGRSAARGRTERGARRILARSLGSESASMKIGRAPRTFQELIFTLQRYWSEEIGRASCRERVEITVAA